MERGDGELARVWRGKGWDDIRQVHNTSPLIILHFVCFSGVLFGFAKGKVELGEATGSDPTRVSVEEAPAKRDNN